MQFTVAWAVAPLPPPPERVTVGTLEFPPIDPTAVIVMPDTPAPAKGFRTTGMPWVKSGLMLESTKATPVRLPMKPYMAPATIAPA